MTQKKQRKLGRSVVADCRRNGERMETTHCHHFRHEKRQAKGLKKEIAFPVPAINAGPSLAVELET